MKTHEHREIRTLSVRFQLDSPLEISQSLEWNFVPIFLLPDHIMSPLSVTAHAAPADAADKPLYHATLGNGTFAVKVSFATLSSWSLADSGAGRTRSDAQGWSDQCVAFRRSAQNGADPAQWTS